MSAEERNAELREEIKGLRTALKDFRQLVGDMRSAQSEFFRTKDGAVLARAKNLEKLVDGELNGQGRLL